MLPIKQVLSTSAPATLADTDNVTGRGDATAGTRSQGRVTVAGAIQERVGTNGGVELPVMLLVRAAKPTPVFRLPVVLLKTASVPVAVFLIPSVLLKSALAPVAVFCAPVSLKTRASKPMAVLEPPVVLSLSARHRLPR